MKMGGSAYVDDWEFASPSSEIRTLVLVGRAGNGKSATGNSILSRLFDFSGDTELIGKEIIRCIKMAKDGIHAVLVVLSVRSRFTREEEAAVDSLRKFFGSSISDYMIVVFTGGDDLEDDGMTLDDYLGLHSLGSLKEILKMCGNRRVLFDNKTKDEVKKSEQLKQLISLVNEVVDKNDGRPFTNELFVELKKGTLKLRDQSAEFCSMEGNSKQEISEFQMQFNKSCEEQLKKMTEMVESKLQETILRLEQSLADEQAARLKGEAAAEAEIQKLREDLARAQDEREELRKKSEKYCVIM
ncbi:hypothetical protein ACJIZ3_019138 [Penstemon smallii]|uniref:AIG1-type G domain-containing protein n=1 Tax=Penstemon smallii TaxID=265156 RepID=A0ABD3T152_9LAMI